MTTAEAPVSRKVVTRNWAGVLIFVVGGGGLVASVMHALLQNNVGAIANIFVLLFGYSLGMVAVLIAAFVLAFGTGHFTSIVGNSGWGRVTLCAWAVLTAASQIAFIGYLTDDAAHLIQAQDVQLTISIATVLVGIAAATFVLRAHVVTGFARISLFVAVLLFAATEALLSIGSPDIGGFWDMPRLAGFALLGLSYWRAGVVRVAAVAAE